MKNRLAFIFLLGILMISCNESTNNNGSAATPTIATNDPGIDATKTIAQNLSADSSFSILVQALKETNLIEILNRPGPFTVFAPSNKAFEKLSDGMLQRLLEEKKDNLEKILSSHIVAGLIRSGELHDGQRLKSILGQQMTIRLRNNKVMINGVNVKSADLQCANGNLRVIEDLIFPQAENAGN